MLAEYLKALKTKRNITSENLAKEAGVSPTFLSRILSGASDNPEWKSIVPVVKVLGGSLDEAAGIKQTDTDGLQKEIADLQKQLADKTALVASYEKSIQNHREVIDTRRTLFEKQAEDLSRHVDDLREQLKVAHAEVDRAHKEVDRTHKVDIWLSIGAVLVMLVAMYFVIDALSPAWGLIQY